MSKEAWQQHPFLEELQTVIKKPPEKSQSNSTRLREAIEPYVDVEQLRELAADYKALEEALKIGEVPEELTWLLSMKTVLLRPLEREQIKGSKDIASTASLK